MEDALCYSWLQWRGRPQGGQSDQFVARSWGRCKKLPPWVHCRALWGLQLTGKHFNLFSFDLWGLLSERGKKPFATGLVFWLFISQDTGSFWRRKRQMLTVNGNHAGQLVSSEVQAELRGRARKFKETLRGSIRPQGKPGEEKRGMDDLNQGQYGKNERSPRRKMRTLGF